MTDAAESRLRGLAGRLRTWLERHPGRRLPDDAGELRAAVVLVLRPPPDPGAERRSGAGDGPEAEEPAPEALFVLRAEVSRDPWSGHVALPGGRRETGDENLRETALRELREETGLVLTDADLLGYLDEIHPRAEHLPSITVTPFVAWLTEGGRDLRGDAEIAGHFWIPVSALADPVRRSTLRLRREGALRVFPTIEYAGHTIWGLTFAIVQRFLLVLEEGEIG